MQNNETGHDAHYHIQAFHNADIHDLNFQEPFRNRYGMITLFYIDRLSQFFYHSGLMHLRSWYKGSLLSQVHMGEIYRSCIGSVQLT